MSLKFREILTHPGGAHKDEFLACCVLAASHGVPIHRREPSDSDMADGSVCVVDVGHRHEPELGNFDHHQLPRDHEPLCSLSLILQDLGLYEDARCFCDWLEPAEWFDCRGPVDTARWMGVEREVMDRLISPMDVTLLRRFARASTLQAGEPLYEIMRMIGEDLLEYLKTLRSRLNWLAEHAEVWSLDLGKADFRVLFVPRTQPLPLEPSSGVDRYIASLQDPGVIGMVYPDRRGKGYGLSRYEDHPHLDFTRIGEEADVHFAHARGFVAKTSATAVERLKELMTLAYEAGERSGA